LKKIIAISSTHGTGKTFLAYNLCIFLKKQGKNVIVLDELARESPFTINTGADDNTQVWLQCKQVVRELELMDKYEYVITDRSVLDAFCYGKVLDKPGTHWTYTYLEKFLVEHIKKYYHKLYLLDIDHFNYNVEDGVRDTDETFRRNVFNQLVNTFTDNALECSLIRNDSDIYSDFTN